MTLRFCLSNYIAEDFIAEIQTPPKMTKLSHKTETWYRNDLWQDFGTEKSHVLKKIRPKIR